MTKSQSAETNAEPTVQQRRTARRDDEDERKVGGPKQPSAIARVHQHQLSWQRDASKSDQIDTPKTQPKGYFPNHFVHLTTLVNPSCPSHAHSNHLIHISAESPQCPPTLHSKNKRPNQLQASLACGCRT